MSFAVLPSLVETVKQNFVEWRYVHCSGQTTLFVLSAVEGLAVMWFAYLAYNHDSMGEKVNSIKNLICVKRGRSPSGLRYITENRIRDIS